MRVSGANPNMATAAAAYRLRLLMDVGPDMGWTGVRVVRYARIAKPRAVPSADVMTGMDPLS
jgi:hypothetical protein